MCVGHIYIYREREREREREQIRLFCLKYKGYFLIFEVSYEIQI